MTMTPEEFEADQKELMADAMFEHERGHADLARVSYRERLRRQRARDRGEDIYLPWAA
jgi:hypothetical protein